LRLDAGGGTSGSVPRLLPIRFNWLWKPGFPQTPEEIRQVWFMNNGLWPSSFADYCPELLNRAAEFKYLKWPYKVRRHIKGKHVVDLGCGRGLHGLGYLLMGARSYTGLDPIVDLDVDLFKDTRIPRVDNMKPIGWTPRKIAERVKRLNYLKAEIADLPESSKWDVLVMHQVTEHLMEIEAVFEHFPRILKRHGKLVFRHPNYYSWGGHHMLPRFLRDIRPDDPEQRRYMDWAHLVYDPNWPDTILNKQNRIRLHELRKVVEKHFVIEEWTTIESSEEEGGKRLTPEILAKHPEFTREELLTQGVVVVARLK